MEFEVGDDDGLARFLDGLGGFGNGGFEILGITFGGRGDSRRRMSDGHIDNVVRDLDVAGAALSLHGADDADDLVGGGLRIEQHGRGAGHFIINALLRVEGADLVMKERIVLAVAGRGSAGDDDHAALFRISAGDGIEHVQPADAVGDGGQAQPWTRA